MKKEMFDYYVKNKILLQNEEDIIIIKKLINKLIDNLYKPIVNKKNSNVFITDNIKLKKYLLTNEPVNWADLHCTEVIKENNTYKAIIEEALGNCENLCKYITKFMNGWGWNVEVKTEW